MKFKYSDIKYSALFFLVISSFIACDKDFTTIDSDIIDNNAAHFDTRNEPFDIITYNNLLEPVQTNNLPVDILGVFNDPLYGKSTASVVSQVSSSTVNPTFGENVVLDSVILTIPYFASALSVEEQETIYELDSVFGNAPIKLSIYENKFFLRDFDPNGETINAPQLYYADGSTGNGTITQSLLEGTLLKEIDEFVPSAEEIVLRNNDSVVTRFSPSLRLSLDPGFWQQKIIDKEGDPVLSNANNFSDYFRGIYFKTEEINDSGNLTLFNLISNNANITLFYTRDSTIEDGERVEASYVLTFSGNRVNFISPLNFDIPEPDMVNGDERLYLKGGQGSTAVVELFNGSDIDNDDPNFNQFEEFKNQFVFTDENGAFVRSKRLINEANLVFYVDQATVQGTEPERIYIYDIKNNIPLVDFVNETANTVNVLDSRTEHLGRLEREGDDATGEGVKYKIRITEHINSLLLRDSTNVKLGIAVSANVNLEFNNAPSRLLNDDDNRVPVSSIVTPRGTVLHGNQTNDPSKKVFLEIFYTEPDLNN